MSTRVTFAVLLVLLCYIRCRHCLSCFKCMTTSFVNDTCTDPFNPVDNRLEHECQATIRGKNGLFPARFCVKISGVIVDMDRHLNRSLMRDVAVLDVLTIPSDTTVARCDPQHANKSRFHFVMNLKSTR